MPWRWCRQSAGTCLGLRLDAPTASDGTLAIASSPACRGRVRHRCRRWIGLVLEARLLLGLCARNHVSVWSADSTAFALEGV